MKRFSLSLSLLSLAVFTYWFTSPEIFLFKWFGISNNGYNFPATAASVLIRNYLPDFLWALALLNTTILLRDFKVSKFYIHTLYLLPFLSEILQLFKFIPGTFDWYDLLVYSIAYLIFFNSKIIFLCKNYLNHSLVP